MGESPADWGKRAKKSGIDDGIQLEYVVSKSYLHLLDKYENSAYDRDQVQTKFDDAESALGARNYAVAVSQLADLAELLDDESAFVEGLQQSSMATAVEGVGPRREEKLSAAGYADPVRLANASAETLAELPTIGRKTAASIRSSSRTLVDDATFVAGLVDDEPTVESYRTEWNELAAQLRRDLVAESVDTLETGLQDLPDPTSMDPDEAAEAVDQLTDLRSSVVGPMDRLATLRESTTDSQWVTVDLDALEPDGDLPWTAMEHSRHPLSLALMRPETSEDEFGISEQRAERVRERSLDRLSKWEAPFDQFEAPVTAFVDQLEQYESIAQWYTPCQEAIEGAEESIERGRSKLEADVDTAATHLETATGHVDQVKLILESATFPPAVRSEFEDRLEELAVERSKLETSITEQRHRETFEEVKKLIDEADEQKAAGHLETAESTLEGAAEQLSTVEPSIDQSRFSTVESELERVQGSITVATISKTLDDIEAGLERAQESVDTDVDTTHDQLSQAREGLTTAQEAFEDRPLPEEQARPLSTRIEELQESLGAVEHQAAVQEAHQELEETQRLITEADELVDTGQLETAESRLQEASSHIASAEPVLDQSEIAPVEGEHARVDDKITAIAVSNDLDDIEDEIQCARESLDTDLSVSVDHLSEARSALELIQETVENEIKTTEQKQTLTTRIDDVRESIVEVQHRATVKEGEQSLADAHELLGSARDAIDASELRGVFSTIEAARERVASVTVDELEDDLTAFHEEAASVREALIDAIVTPALNETEHELNRARGYLQHDVDDTRERLQVARNHLRAADHLTDDNSLSQPVRESLAERADRYHSQVQTLVDSCREREIAEAIDEAADETGDVREAFRSGAVEKAQEQVDSAAARIENVPDDAPESAVEELWEELETVRTKIAQHEVSEDIANAEATVDEAEAERAAGEETAAIDAYQRAIDTYETVQLDAQDASVPEEYEIERRIEQLHAEIDKVRDQWIETLSMQIDRELRAGERAVAQGLDAATEGDIEMAETKYEIAEEAATATRGRLHESIDDPTGGELSLPPAVRTEYQSATSSLTGHLGYLRTQIQEAADTAEGASHATLLAEYYDGLYTVYRALPDTVHPLWRDALTTVLFGGDGLEAGVTEFGTQQAERNEASISTLREENGNGDQITEFFQIDTAAPRPEDQKLVDANQQLPVAPESNTVFPVDVDSSSVLDAIRLLAEVPAYPAADDDGGNATALLDVSYFEERFTDNRDTMPAESASIERSVSNELSELQQELEAQIGDS